jgi:hypothetical protein
MRTTLGSLLLILLPATALGQATTSEKGAGVVTLQYIHFSSGDHLFSTDAIDGETSRGYTAEGNRWYLGDTTAHTLLLYFDYGIRDRLGVSGTMAMVSSKYEGRAPVNRDIDDGEYHPTWQDFGIDLRYMLLTQPLMATVSGGIGSPLTSYPDVGHTAVGRNLTEVRAALFLAKDITPRFPIYSSLIYGVSEELDGINLQRLTVNLGTGYLVRRELYTEIFGAYQDALNGEDWISEDPSNPVVHGDPSTGYKGALTGARLLNIGTSISVDTPLRTNLALTVSTTVWGENVEDGIYAGIAASWRFGGKSEKDWGEDW